MKITIALGVVAALLLAFILVFERGSVTSSELQSREPAVLQRFVRDRVTKLEIQRGGVTTVLYRAPDPESGFEHGLWVLEAPLKADADQEAVDVLLGELEWMDNRRRLQHVTPSDRARFGLDAPRFRVWYTVGSERLLMRVGSETPTGDGVYVEGDRPDVVFVVGKDLPEALDHPPGHYHTKELHDGIMLLSAEAITLRGEQGEVVVEKHDGRFRLVAPVHGLVDREALSEVFRALDRLRGTRFVSATVDDPARYGLDAPVFEADVKKRSLLDDAPAKGEQKFETLTRHLRLGGPCEGHAGEAYFVVDEGPVFCVVEAELGAARKGPDALRDQRLLVLDDDQIGDIEIDAGDERITLARKATGDDDADDDVDAPRYQLRHLRGEHEVQSFDVDPHALEEWLAALRGSRAEAFEQGAAEGPVNAAELRIRFGRLDDAPAYAIASQGDDLVRRADEPQLVRFAKDAVALLDVSAARFRERTLFRADPGTLSELSLRGPGRDERVARDAGGRYTLTAPVALPADAPTVQELARLLSGLQAQRFVADAPAPEYGLGVDATRVTARFGGADGPLLKLRVGAAVDGSHYASLDPDGAVFVLPAGVSAALAQPLVSRGQLAIPAADVQAVTVRPAVGSGCSAHREGDAFVVESGFADAAAVDRFVQALGALRAAAVAGYGATAARTAATADGPHAVISIQTPDGPRTLRILTPPATLGQVGAPAPHYPARRDDLEVTFELSRADIERLLACTAAPD